MAPKILAIFAITFLLLTFLKLIGFMGKTPFPTLPGDILIKKLGVDVYLPFTSTIILTIIITLVINWI